MTIGYNGGGPGKVSHTGESHSQTVGVGRSAEVNRTMSYQFPRETTSLIKFIYSIEYDQLLPMNLVDCTTNIQPTNHTCYTNFFPLFLSFSCPVLYSGTVPLTLSNRS